MSVAVLAALIIVRQTSGIECRVDVEEQPDRPNVVLILFDDLDVALTEALPGWRAIEERGLRFSNAFVTSPLCCPSRASILTGQYAHTHGIHTNAGPMGGYHRGVDLRFERCTVAVWMQQAGYETIFLGKYLNGYGYDSDPRQIPAGWDRWQALWANTPFRDFVLNVDGRLEAGQGHQTDELAARAVQFLADANGPTFLMLDPFVPHRPWTPPARYESAPVPDGYPRPDRYRAMLAGVDLVNSVIEALPPNTYLIVTSDNGFHFEPDVGKATPSDLDTRVPLVIIGPDVVPAENGDLVANIDIAPTIADWAGVSAPGAEGTSLVPLIDGRDIEWRTSLTLEMVGEWSARRTLTGVEDLRYEASPSAVDD